MGLCSRCSCVFRSVYQKQCVFPVRDVRKPIDGLLCDAQHIVSRCRNAHIKTIVRVRCDLSSLSTDEDSSAVTGSEARMRRMKTAGRTEPPHESWISAPLKLVSVSECVKAATLCFSAASLQGTRLNTNSTANYNGKQTETWKRERRTNKGRKQSRRNDEEGRTEGRIGGEEG